jgi:hypothetical protein
MAAGDTSLSICSDALIMLGARPISSFNDGTDEANVADRLYHDIKNQILMTYPWSFSFKKEQLAQLVTTPTNEYRYEYALSGDRLGSPRKVFNSGSVGAYPIQGYKIMGDKILTNEQTIYAEYQYSTPEYAMPAYFVQLLKYVMAWHFALPITDQVDKAQYWQSVAVGSPAENGRGGYMRTSINIDGQNNPVQSIEDYSLIAVRY